MKNRKNILLYTTGGCHLCEQASELFSHKKVKAIMVTFGLEVKPTEISLDEALVERFGLSIPVLQFEGSRSELCWPFGEDQLISFIQSSCQRA